MSGLQRGKWNFNCRASKLCFTCLGLFSLLWSATPAIAVVTAIAVTEAAARVIGTSIVLFSGESTTKLPAKLPLSFPSKIYHAPVVSPKSKPLAVHSIRLLNDKSHVKITIAGGVVFRFYQLDCRQGSADWPRFHKVSLHNVNGSQSCP